MPCLLLRPSVPATMYLRGTLLRRLTAAPAVLQILSPVPKPVAVVGVVSALLKSVCDNELTKRGVEVKKDICEHFAYSPSELFHLVKVAKIQSFETLIETTRQGLGCRICKPAIASILASVWNEFILKPEHVSLARHQ